MSTRPKKKQPPKNGFYYFMLDYKLKEQKKGKNYSDMAKVAEAAGPFWAQMSAEEKEPYNVRAKQERGGGKKYTSQGVDVEVILKQEQEKEQMEEKMREDIKGIISKALEEDRLPEEVFYVIHVNDFCYSNSEQLYYLAEFSVGGFSLLNGIDENLFHRIVIPAPIPMGYSYQALKTSKETHQLQVPDRSEPSNLDEVFSNFLHYLRLNLKDPVKDKLPPIYAYDKDLEKTRSIIWQLCYQFGLPEDTFRVYSLSYMFFKLRNACREDAIPFLTLARQEMEKEIYDQTRNIACSAHEMSDAIVHCSRSKVIRAAYQICDACCPDVGVDLIPGQHIPKGSNLSHSSMSRYSSASRAPVYFESAEDGGGDRADTRSVASCRSESTVKTLSSFGWKNEAGALTPTPGSVFDEDNMSVSESLAGSTVDNLEDFMALGGSVSSLGNNPWKTVPSKPSSSLSQPRRAGHAGGGDEENALPEGMMHMGISGRGRGGRGSASNFRYQNAALQSLSSTPKPQSAVRGPRTMPSALINEESTGESPISFAPDNAWGNRPESSASILSEDNFPALGGGGRRGGRGGRGRGFASAVRNS